MKTSRRALLAGVVVCGFVAIAAAVPTVVPADDAVTVAALDTEYQAAVKHNDAAAMDRILADDFVLVTGRGQTYTKADLLRDARNKTSVYEHQEELEQKVRVGRHGGGDRAAVDQGHERRQAVRANTVVQRHVRADTKGMAIRAWTGFVAVAEPMKYEVRSLTSILKAR
jgi:hypothetical protein